MPRSKHHRRGRSNSLWRKLRNKAMLSRQWFNGKHRKKDIYDNLIKHANNIRRLK